MTRIVAGEAGGRRLATPPGRETRPTSQRAREALFGSLGALVELSGARVLDLYAGSGAVGLEALSRGAAQATFVESDPRAAGTIRANAAALGLSDRAVVVRARVEQAVAASPPVPYQVIFADPPYGLADTDVDDLVRALADQPWMAAGGVLVVERRTGGPGPTWPESLFPQRARRYGEGTLWYGRRP